MSFMFLNFKLEDTIKGFLKPHVQDNISLYGFGEMCGKDEELAEPWIGIRCESSTSGPADVQLNYPVANRLYTAEIMIRTHAEDIIDTDGKTVIRTARDYHGDLCGQILDLFFVDSIIDDLNVSAVGQIFVNQIDQPTIDTTTEDRSFVTKIVFPILCNPME